MQGTFTETQCYNSGALTATGAETVHDTTVAIDYAIDGKEYQKSAIADGTTPTTDYNDSAAFTALVGGNNVANTPGQGCVFVWALDSSGNVKVMQGPVHALDMQNNFITAPQFPAVKSDVCPFAYMVVKAGATASTSWILGTDNWNATGMTVTVVDVMKLPNRPQVS